MNPLGQEMLMLTAQNETPQAHVHNCLDVVYVFGSNRTDVYTS